MKLLLNISDNTQAILDSIQKNFNINISYEFEQYLVWLNNYLLGKMPNDVYNIQNEETLDVLLNMHVSPNEIAKRSGLYWYENTPLTDLQKVILEDFYSKIKNIIDIIETHSITFDPMVYFTINTETPEDSENNSGLDTDSDLITELDLQIIESINFLEEYSEYCHAAPFYAFGHLILGFDIHTPIGVEKIKSFWLSRKLNIEDSSCDIRRFYLFLSFCDNIVFP